MSRDLLSEKQTFVINLGKALHQFGTPAHRLELHLKNVASFLGLQGSFMVMPTGLTFILAEEMSVRPFTHLVRVEPGELDLGSLARTDELVEELACGSRTLTQAIERLDEIVNKPQPYSTFSTLIAFCCSGGAFALLMAGSWNDVVWSALLSLVNSLLVHQASKSRRFANMLEPLVALVSALLASAIAQIDPSINTSLVVLSAIIIFIPGLALTLGLAELSNRHLVSGTARIMDGIMCMFKLYFGTVLGMTIGAKLWQPVAYLPLPSVPHWTSWIAVALLSGALVIMFKSRLKDAPWGILAGFIAYTSTLLASVYLDVSLSAFVGAFTIGIYSNLFARFMKAPALIVSLQGVVLLVPGSKVYIGLNTLISGESAISSSAAGGQTFLIFMSLVAGLIFANVIVPPTRSL